MGLRFANGRISQFPICMGSAHDPNNNGMTHELLRYHLIQKLTLASDNQSCINETNYQNTIIVKRRADLLWLLSKALTFIILL
jgi:hypothetical protein